MRGAFSFPAIGTRNNNKMHTFEGLFTATFSFDFPSGESPFILSVFYTAELGLKTQTWTG